MPSLLMEISDEVTVELKIKIIQPNTYAFISHLNLGSQTSQFSRRWMDRSVMDK